VTVTVIWMVFELSNVHYSQRLQSIKSLTVLVTRTCVLTVEITSLLTLACEVMGSFSGIEVNSLVNILDEQSIFLRTLLANSIREKKKNGEQLKFKIRYFVL
jgi:hypothetical protein